MLNEERETETSCSCCNAEFETMFKGTDGTVYCNVCRLRGGRMIIGCLTCNDEPPIVTRVFRVIVP